MTHDKTEHHSTNIIYLQTDRKTENHWSLNVQDNGIAWLTLDQKESSTNVLSGAVLNELNIMLDIIYRAIPKGLVIRSAKKKGFIAGADIKGFTTLKNQTQAQESIRQTIPIFERLEKLPCPTVAIIHGFCLGGGLELALACDYRVAEDADSTRLGLPEVKLGIHPGFGGTIRLSRQIGSLNALEMMLTGRTLSARSAKKLGVVDRIAPLRHLQRTAMQLMDQKPPRHRPGLLNRLVNLPPIRFWVAHWLKQKTETLAPKKHYPAPHALIDQWRSVGWKTSKSLFEREADSVATLITGQTSGNLIRLFLLQERLKSLGKHADFKPQRVHVVGAGIMGGDIAAWCALKGMTVTLQDQNNTIISKAVKRASDLFYKKQRNPFKRQATMDRFIPDPEGYGVYQADVVIEAIYENLEAKQQLLADLETKLKPGALLASNTSSICLEHIANVLHKPERLLGLHFFNPVAKMPLLEVVYTKDTHEKTIQAGCRFATTIKRSPLPVKSGPGFLINRILMPYLLEAVTLVSEGCAPEEVDRIATEFGMPMGPITLADVVGLDICLAVANNLNRDKKANLPQLLMERVKSGHLGCKTGEGFYRYKKGKQSGSFLQGSIPTPEDMDYRLFGLLFNESVACLRDGVVEDADLLDIGVVFGTGFAPFRGGPIQTIQQQGSHLWRNRLLSLSVKHGERFIPDPGWGMDLFSNPLDHALDHSLQNLEKNHERLPRTPKQQPYTTLEGPHLIRLVPRTG